MLSQARPTSDFVQSARTADRALEWPVQRDPHTFRGADDARPAISRVLAAHAVDGEVVDAMIERLAVGVAVTDRNGGLVYANAAARSLPLADFPELQTMVAQSLLTGEEIGEAQRAYLGQDRARHWLTVTVTPARGTDGRTVAAMITLVDVTTQIQAREWRPVIDSLLSL